jgi:hypothetical protein
LFSDLKAQVKFMLIATSFMNLAYSLICFLFLRLTISVVNKPKIAVIARNADIRQGEVNITIVTMTESVLVLPAPSRTVSVTLYTPVFV